MLDTDGLAVLDNCQDVIDSIPKLMRDEKNIEDAHKEGNELFLDVCESFRYGVISYASEQVIPREVEIQREIMSIKDNTQKYQRFGADCEASKRHRIPVVTRRKRLMLIALGAAGLRVANHLIPRCCYPETVP